jgi:hypothetical protein
MRTFRTCSRPQHKTDRWIGQYSLRRSFIGTLRVDFQICKEGYRFSRIQLLHDEGYALITAQNAAEAAMRGRQRGRG